MNLPEVPDGFMTSVDVRDEAEVERYTARRIIAMCPSEGIYRHPTDRNRKISAAPADEVEEAILKFLENGGKTFSKPPKKKTKKKRPAAKKKAKIPLNGAPKHKRNLIAPGRGGDSFGVTINGELAARLHSFKRLLKGFANTNEDVAHILLDEALTARGH